MANSNIFAIRTYKSVLNSFFVTCVSSCLVSLSTLLNFSLNLHSFLFIPVVLAAVFVFVKVTLRSYVRYNVHYPNRFRKAIRGIYIQTISCALLCSACAWCFSCLNSLNTNKNHWSLINAGCAVAGGIFHYESIYTDQGIYFPIIQTTKYTMFMSKVSDIVIKSLKKSLIYTFFIYIPLYGVNPSLCSKVNFILHLWFSISFILYLFLSIEHVVYLNMTERIKFPIVTLTQENYSLLDALNSNIKIIKLLALYDLYQATINDISRRKDIFSLSFAGNVPQSWKTIFNFCVSHIEHSTEDLTNFVKRLPPITVNRRIITNARLIQLNGCTKSNEELNNKPNKLTLFLEKSIIYNYIFGPLEKEKTIEEFEAVVWCCYILSNLAVASLKEDEYGIVREHLGQIVSSIINLKSPLEMQRRDCDDKNIKIIEYFKMHVKTCSIMLAMNFSKYANDIGLDDNQLCNFKKLIASINDC
ncbi:nucleoporin ndc-1-like [Daktulosphaira vitifoliae]|uniref:nucleoporin ndc-1-like n=1 Tax=Daktulosphaira vitifoliae TaxID=58002 RepID=UPI0021AA1024|nr:nucleoporin ndc-1-like [Daktulosphaira vitifoliae]